MRRTSTRSVSRSRVSWSSRGGRLRSSPTSIAPCAVDGDAAAFGRRPTRGGRRARSPRSVATRGFGARRAGRLAEGVDRAAQPGKQAGQTHGRGRVLHAVRGRVRLAGRGVELIRRGQVSVGQPRLRLLQGRHRTLEVRVDRGTSATRRRPARATPSKQHDSDAAQDQRADGVAGARSPVPLAEAAVAAATGRGRGRTEVSRRRRKTTRKRVRRVEWKRGDRAPAREGSSRGSSIPAASGRTGKAGSSGRFLHLPASAGSVLAPEQLADRLVIGRRGPPWSPPASTGSSCRAGTVSVGSCGLASGMSIGASAAAGKVAGGVDGAAGRDSTARRTSCRTASAWPWIRAARLRRNSRSRAMYSAPTSAPAACRPARRSRRRRRGP